MPTLAGWQNFYVIVGSSAGALIGLQFVVITLISDMPIARGQAQVGSAFATPTIVHFGAVLMLAAIACAPWHGIVGAAVLWGLLGVGGIMYEILVLRNMRAQIIYTPVFEDWLFHAVLPLVAYATLAGSAYGVRFQAHNAMFAVGAAALLLLFIGIHNAWDAVTYHVFVNKRGKEGNRAHPESTPLSQRSGARVNARSRYSSSPRGRTVKIDRRRYRARQGIKRLLEGVDAQMIPRR
jgi:hypothetical protein